MTEKQKLRCAGKIILHDIKLEPQELFTIKYFLELGKDVEIVIPSNTKKSKNADFYMDGVLWEAKCPRTSNINTLIVRLKHATKQSQNLIIDLRKITKNYENIEKAVLEKMKKSRTVRRFKIITKNGKLIDG